MQGTQFVFATPQCQLGYMAMQGTAACKFERSDMEADVLSASYA